MEINLYQLRMITEAAAELGALSALIKTGKLKPYLNKSEAFKIFGRATVEQWVRDGWIAVRKDGNYSAAWRIDRIEIELLSKSLIIYKLT
jgi:hypothetical protein